MTKNRILYVVLLVSIVLNVTFGVLTLNDSIGEDEVPDLKIVGKAVEYMQGEKPESRTLPNQTPLVNHELDKNGVSIAYLPDGKAVYNVFEVATQAMEGNATLLNLKNNNDKHYIVPKLPVEKESSGLDGMQYVALRWLEDNARELKDSLVWYYEFDNAFNDVAVKSPWPSAFGQAHVIKAFVSAYKTTKDKDYLDLAVKAAYAYDVPIEDGGFKSTMDDGSIFFEEVPTEHPTHILNGHMISTVSLLELSELVKDDKVSRLAAAGAETIKKKINLYDTGYWSRYDLNPKKGEVIFRIGFDDDNINDKPAMVVDSVKLTDDKTNDSVLLDIGRDDDFAGAWRISGTEWLAGLDEKGVGRQLIDGRSVHKEPVKGGSIMNTYVIAQLPEWESKMDSLDKPFNVQFEIRYQDLQAKKVELQIQNINEGNFLDFVNIPGGEWNTTGDGQWKTMNISIPSSQLGWYMGPDYQKYHIKVLEELSKLTKDSFFSDVASRWKTYLDNYIK